MMLVINAEAWLGHFWKFICAPSETTFLLSLMDKQ